MLFFLLKKYTYKFAYIFNKLTRRHFLCFMCVCVCVQDNSEIGIV